MEISLTGSDKPAGAYLKVIVAEGESRVGGVRAFSLAFWERVNSSGTYLRILPSGGFYGILVWAPAVWNITNHYVMDYAITLRVRSQENYVPFFVEERTRGFR